MNHATPSTLNRLMRELELKRMGASEEAGLCITSLPVPRGVKMPTHFEGRATCAKPLGQWPGQSHDAMTPTNFPRRVLLAGDCEYAPQTLRVSHTPVAPSHQLPIASAELFARSQETEFVWERHALRIDWGGRSVAMAMGMRVKGEMRWWEFSRLVELSRSTTCVEVLMAGSIPHMLFTGDELRKYPGYSYPGLHRHHWLSGQIYARLHHNGVCEIYARHVNSKFVDDGLLLPDSVPIVALRCESKEKIEGVDLGKWDGSQTRSSVSDVALDLTDASHMASATQPGRMDFESGFLLWQPYLGMELFGGLCPKQLTGDPYIYRAEQQVIPRGMARSLRFSLSLNPARSPRVARYLAPTWWFGQCEEFSPTPALPVEDRFDESLKGCSQFIRQYMVRNTFEDGSMPRVISQSGSGPHEPSWEGEAAGAALLLAYRTGDATDYDDALRIAYCFTDVYVDHASKLVRMHGFAPNATALPMNRIHACVYAWLETGDDFCIEAAQAVIENAYWSHKNSWPRMAVGRDACFIRGAMLLYRFLNDTHFLDIARKSIADVCASQRPEGWFGDQGGGSGIHGWAAYICKPWMGLMAVGGLLDYLEMFPDGDPAALDCVKRFADWLMQARFDHDGNMGWSYQHSFNGQIHFLVSQTGQRVMLPTKELWHLDYFARLLTFCTIRFGDPAYSSIATKQLCAPVMAITVLRRACNIFPGFRR